MSTLNIHFIYHENILAIRINLLTLHEIYHQSLFKYIIMSIGTFSYPMPVNEPVLSYAPGSPERKRLKEVLAELKRQEIDVPMYIGSKEVRTNKKVACIRRMK